MECYKITIKTVLKHSHGRKVNMICWIVLAVLVNRSFLPFQDGSSTLN